MQYLAPRFVIDFWFFGAHTKKGLYFKAFWKEWERERPFFFSFFLGTNSDFLTRVAESDRCTTQFGYISALNSHYCAILSQRTTSAWHRCPNRNRIQLHFWCFFHWTLIYVFFFLSRCWVPGKNTHILSYQPQFFILHVCDNISTTTQSSSCVNYGILHRRVTAKCYSLHSFL